MTLDSSAGLARVIGMLAAALILILCAFASHIVLGDPDVWWHIKTGQDILASGAFPHADTYSHTMSGQPWIAKEWLAQILLALSFTFAGWNGAALLASLAATAAAAALYSELAKHLRPSLAAAITIATFFVLLPVIIARPHIFTFVLLVILAAKLFEAARAGKAPSWWLLLIFVLWANLHGSFTMAFVVEAFAFLELLVLWRLQDRGVVLRWIAFGIASAVATLINPYGLQPLIVSLNIVSGVEAMSLINEWQPFNAQVDRISEANLLFALGLILLARPKLSWPRIFFVIFAMHMMFQHMRFAYFFFLLLPLLVARDVAEENPKLSRAWWDRQPRDETQQLAARFSGVLQGAIAAAALAAFIFLGTTMGFRPPLANALGGAFGYFRSALPKGNVFNDYNFGGPLIWRGVKTFVDGRSDQLYLGGFMKAYMDSGKKGGGEAFIKLLDSKAVNWTLLPPEDRRNETLARMPNWKQTFADSGAVIYERQ